MGRRVISVYTLFASWRESMWDGVEGGGAFPILSSSLSLAPFRTLCIHVLENGCCYGRWYDSFTHQSPYICCTIIVCTHILQPQENCSGRYIKMTQRVGLRFAEHQAMQQQRAANAAAAAASGNWIVKKRSPLKVSLTQFWFTSSIVGKDGIEWKT